MLHAPRHHKNLPSLQNDIPISQLDIQGAVHNQEHLVRIRMRVPNELAEQLGELDLVVIEGSDRALGPVVREASEKVLEVEGFHIRTTGGGKWLERRLGGLASYL